MKKSILFIIFICFINHLNAQNNLNAYKYVVVPKKFDFQKSEDEYQLSSLVKFLFEKQGFEAVFEGIDPPKDLYNNPCLGLKTKVIEASNLFTTKLQIELINCRAEVVFTSNEGKSKIKDFKKGHHDALRKAFESVKTENYAYNPNLSKSIKKETNIVVAQTVKEPEPIIEEKVKKEAEDKPIKTVQKEESSVEEVPTEKINQDKVMVIKNGKEEPAVFAEYKTLYAQGIENGFQLVDNTPQKVFVALKSSTEGLYYLKNKAGILYKEGEKWYAQYYKDNQLVKEELNIKF